MKTLLFAVGLAALVGCAGLKPAGPFAKPVPITQQGKPLPAAPADPTPPPAVRPTPPVMYVGPDDVAANPHDAAARLASELTADGKSASAAPVTVEVSRVKRK